MASRADSEWKGATIAYVGWRNDNCHRHVVVVESIGERCHFYIYLR